MIIKKFIAKTESEAVEIAKKELGNNVVIMNVKTVKRKGIFSFIKQPLVEVTVALEDDSERYLPSSARQNVEKKVEALENAVKESNAIEEKLDSLQSLLVQQLNKPEPVKKDDENTVEDTGHKDEEAVKEDKSEKSEELDKFIKLLSSTMIENEVDEKYVNQLLEEIQKIQKPNAPLDFTLTNLYQKMILRFGQQEGITPAEKIPKVVFFIGPTGVGKTTTIAKIASKTSVDEKKKVVLLTADTYRIAAAEQLRTYANILQVPFQVIYSPEEIQEAIKKYQDYDYIYVDTAGHSHQNKEQREGMNNIIHSVDGLCEKEVFLVLSATTKYRDLINIANTYSEMTEYKLIFTKLDETTALGNLLNLKLHTDALLSYVTYGQNVPDDIEQFNPQKTVKQILGGKK